MSTSVYHRCRGVTLLELLVAISIFAVLASIGYGGLQMILESKAQTDVRAERLTALQVTSLMLERDLSLAVSRPVRDVIGDPVEALHSIPNEPLLMELTRGSHLNPLNQPRSELQRVAYRLRGDVLYREQWAVLDQSTDSTPLESAILEDIEDLELRFLDAQGKWTAYWPPANAFDADYALPKAVEFTLVLPDLGRIRRIIQVPGG